METLGRETGQGLSRGDVISLTGPLGAGKTVFARGVARSLGISEPIVSPTFTIVQEYDVPRNPGARLEGSSCEDAGETTDAASSAASGSPGSSFAAAGETTDATSSAASGTSGTCDRAAEATVGAVVAGADSPASRPDDAKPRRMTHIDLYRLSSAEEFEQMGGEDMLYGDGVCLVEWPGIIEDMLPENTLRITILVNSDGSRTVHLERRDW